MVEDRPEDTGSLPDSDRPKRAPPTIDLEASEVTTEAAPASDAAPPEAAAETSTSPDTPAPAPVSPWVVAPVSRAVAAALVIGVGRLLGWPAIRPASTPLAPQLNAAAIDDLTARIAGLETRIGKPAASAADPASTARMETLEKSLAALRGELATSRAQSE